MNQRCLTSETASGWKALRSGRNARNKIRCGWQTGKTKSLRRNIRWNTSWSFCLAATSRRQSPSIQIHLNEINLDFSASSCRALHCWSGNANDFRFPFGGDRNNWSTTRAPRENWSTAATRLNRRGCVTNATLATSPAAHAHSASVLPPVIL